MRRAGYEVRVLAEEGSSFEQNPPTLVEFIRRDLRWCQGNMQYWHFLRDAGAAGRSAAISSLFAILMFLGSPAWIGMLLIGSTAVALAPTPARFHPRRCRARALRRGAGDVVRAQDRDRDRRADARRAAAHVRRRTALHGGRDHRGDLLPAVGADHVGEPHAVPVRPAVRPHDRLGRAGARRSRGAVVARRPAVLAADLDRAVRRSRCWP